MGQEIDKAEFSNAEFAEFQQRLEVETRLLEEMLRNKTFQSRHEVGGYELEAWLLDSKTRPAAINQRFLDQMDNPLVVHELSRFNVELNSEPQALKGKVFSRMQADMSALWESCSVAAQGLDSRLAMIGTLPVLRDNDLTMANMSEIERYQALNEQVLRLRKGMPIKLDIRGRDHLQSSHYDVMLEAAATSFQIHMQVKPEQAVRYYNASVLASAPLLALAANSPYLFGRDLWAESRIALFEQAVNTDEKGEIGHTGHSRVTFGHNWCKESVFEMFQENLQLYHVLLPTLHDGEPAELWHLRLHNGTVWRWNRPLIGIDDAAGYHLRIEQRVAPAGPSIIDMIANAAFYYGLVASLASEATAPESKIAFARVKADFYTAAREGLEAEISWPGSANMNVRELLIGQLLPAAHSGLVSLKIDETDVEYYLGIIQARLECGQNGTSWQRKYIAHHKCSMKEMTEAYLTHQQSLKPVHEWAI